MLKGTPVALPEMLACREARVRQQQTCLKQYKEPLISFCLNMPGPIKTSPELRKAFDCGQTAILTALQKEALPLLVRMERHESTGDECLLAVKGEALKIKTMMTQIEETHPLGRLFDIDVLNPEGEKLSRPLPRRCLICGRQAQVCASRRLHSVAELTAKVEAILQDYFSRKN